MNEDKYFKLMCGFDKKMKFKELHRKWYKCFKYILKKRGFNKTSINQLFYRFDMENWSVLHLENTDYKNHTKEQLISRFCYEAYYISDMMSYDRLFRTHWLFKQAFNEELKNKK